MITAWWFHKYKGYVCCGSESYILLIYGPLGSHRSFQCIKSLPIYWNFPTLYSQWTLLSWVSDPVCLFIYLAKQTYVLFESIDGYLIYNCCLVFTTSAHISSPNKVKFFADNHDPLIHFWPHCFLHLIILRKHW